MGALEKQIENILYKRYGTDPRIKFWRANVASIKVGDRWIACGLKGQADMTGILQNGKRIEIEIKTTDRQSPAQANFQKMIEKLGGIYIIVRTGEELEKILLENQV